MWHLRSNKTENGCLLICVQTCCTPFGLNQFRITVSAPTEVPPLVRYRIDCPKTLKAMEIENSVVMFLQNDYFTNHLQIVSLEHFE